MQELYYFAYGSNLNQEQMKRRCPDSELVETVSLQDYRLIYNSVATIEKEQGQQVIGAVYRISLQDLCNLDHYEGYPDLYDREVLEVEATDSDKTYQALTYIMNGRMRFNADTGEFYEEVPLELPSRNYFETIRQGYLDWGLNTSRQWSDLYSVAFQIDEKISFTTDYRCFNCGNYFIKYDLHPNYYCPECGSQRFNDTDYIPQE